MNDRGTAARIWIDGAEQPVERARIEVAGAGWLEGLGVFETIALRGGRAIDLERHLTRLDAAASALELEPPPVEHLLVAARAAAATAFPRQSGWLKLVLPGRARSIVLCGELDLASVGRSATAIVLPWRRSAQDPSVAFKTMCRTAHVLGQREASRRGADEGLWLNGRGRLAEGCTSNVFLVRGERLVTPALREGLLPGLTRERVIEAARGLGLPVDEGRISRKALERAREAFLTSSLRGVRPLVAVDGRPVGRGGPGSTTLRVAREVARLRGLPGGPVAARVLDTPGPGGEV